MGPRPEQQAEALACLAALVEEFCEATSDTVVLAANDDLGPRWQRHIDYLQALGRLSQATLARAGVDVVV